jgi:hypothetical protein
MQPSAGNPNDAALTALRSRCTALGSCAGLYRLISGAARTSTMPEGREDAI